MKPAMALCLLTVTIVAIMPACEKATRAPTAGASSSPRQTGAPSQTIAPRQTIAPTNPAVATVPFDLSGSGDRDTAFQSTGPWKMTWNFDCANLGQTGDFTLAVTGDKGTDRTTSGGAGMQGHGSVTSSDPTKTFNLKIRSACRWQISASS
jgi:hypothetical protein